MPFDVPIDRTRTRQEIFGCDGMRATYLNRIQRNWQLNHFVVFRVVPLTQIINFSKELLKLLKEVRQHHVLGQVSGENVSQSIGHCIGQGEIPSVAASRWLLSLTVCSLLVGGFLDLGKKLQTHVLDRHGIINELGVILATKVRASFRLADCSER